jgi:hypothetical protein
MILMTDESQLVTLLAKKELLQVPLPAEVQVKEHIFAFLNSNLA